jgi:RNA polymerase sigma-70 factor (ECF subfamily)
MTSERDRRSRFETIWDLYRLEVLAYCLRRTAAADAEDVCAETFVIAWRRIDEIPPGSRALLWLYGTARRVLANQWRSVQRRSRLEQKLSGLGVITASDPALVAVQRAEDRTVVEAVQALRARDREIVMLDAWEEISREDIAHLLGMTRAAVDQRIHRAYDRLARTLEPRMNLKPAVSPPVAEKGGT